MYYRLCSFCRSLTTGMRSALSRTSSSQTHMGRTQDSTRCDVVSEVAVTGMKQLSPTVKGFTLHVDNSKLNFKPGQWVDLHIPGEDIVGGYSITSTPNQLAERGSMSLAIQYSDHPPTHWMYTRCKVNEKLSIRVGGDFTYAPPTTHDMGDLLLIGGGVGINPLFSMLQHHTWLLQTAHDNSEQGPSSIEPRKDSMSVGRVCLLYSAKTKDELLFKGPIDEIQSQCNMVDVTYFVTKEKLQTLGPDGTTIKSKRLGVDDIRHAVSRLDESILQCYICGPPPMTEHLLHVLTDGCGIDSKSIHFEKWW